jgi:hypothetical protein
MLISKAKARDIRGGQDELISLGMNNFVYNNNMVFHFINHNYFLLICSS